MEKNIHINLFQGAKSKYIETNKFTNNPVAQKNFMNGIQNARNILKSLERSLRKSRRYEGRLLQCQGSHRHAHSLNEWWEDDVSEDVSKCSKAGTTKSSRSRVDLVESWSTMSIVCLQYQYDELSKRYESLLQAYDERCNSLSARDALLVRLRHHVRVTHARLSHAHKTLLAVGEKYMALRDRRLAQKVVYEEKITRLKSTVRDVLMTAEQARIDLDEQIACSMAVEQDSATSLLLAEVRKCNLLVLENMRLKTQIQELAPGQVNW